jgi:hypothetical protein
VSDDLRRLTTEEQREQLFTARRRGGMCAACGRVLSADEPAYIERFVVGGTWAAAPVGVECASPELLQQVAGQEPERCAGCGRGVYYRMASSRRRQALCSRACGVRVQAAKRPLAEA